MILRKHRKTLSAVLSVNYSLSDTRAVSPDLFTTAQTHASPSHKRNIYCFFICFCYLGPLFYVATYRAFRLVVTGRSLYQTADVAPDAASCNWGEENLAQEFGRKTGAESSDKPIICILKGSNWQRISLLCIWWEQQTKWFENYNELKSIASHCCTSGLLPMCQTSDTNSFLFTEWLGVLQRDTRSRNRAQKFPWCALPLSEEKSGMSRSRWSVFLRANEREDNVVIWCSCNPLSEWTVKE